MTTDATITSRAAVLAVSAVAAVVLVGEAAVGLPATLGAAGAVMLSAAVWASDWERHRVLGRLVASLLVVPVGVGIVAATAGTVLVLSGGLFPVPSVAQLPQAVVRLVARAAVVAGSVGVVLGAAVSVRGALSRASVERTAGVSLQTAMVPLGIGVALAAARVLTRLEGSAGATGPNALVADALSAVTDPLFSPTPGALHLASFAFLTGLALVSLARAVAALPLSELATDHEVAATVEAARTWLQLVGSLLLVAVPLAGIFQFAVSPARQRFLLSVTVYDLLAGLTSAPGIRALAWWTILASGTVVVAVWALRRTVRASTSEAGSSAAPFVGGTAVAAAAVAVADPVATGAVDWTADTLPGEFGTIFRETATAFLEFFGPVAIVLSLVGVIALTVTATLGFLWLIVFTGYVDDRTAGVTVASGSLFTAAAFAGVLDADPLLILAALVAALVVWDVGEFGTTLGAEVGGGSTRRTELVHATGSLAVGGVGAGAALALEDLATGPLSTAGQGVAVGLTAVVAGLLLLVVALR